MLRDDQAAALEAVLAREFSFRLLLPSSPEAAVLSAVADALASATPGAAAPVVSELTERLRSVSVTVWTPLGTVVVVSPNAIATTRLRARTVAHEATHARQILHLGAQVIPDYLGSPELRATREAQACVVAAWVDFLFYGMLPSTAHEIVRSLSSCLYCLGEEERELARGIAASGLATMKAGGVPPYDVAAIILQWAQTEAPEAIEAEPHRVTAVPNG